MTTVISLSASFSSSIAHSFPPCSTFYLYLSISSPFTSISAAVCSAFISLAHASFFSPHPLLYIHTHLSQSSSDILRYPLIPGVFAEILACLWLCCTCRCVSCNFFMLPSFINGCVSPAIPHWTGKVKMMKHYRSPTGFGAELQLQQMLRLFVVLHTPLHTGNARLCSEGGEEHLEISDISSRTLSIEEAICSGSIAAV